MISRMYQLYELRDEMNTALEKMNGLIELEKEFIQLIKDSGKYEKFKFMLESFEEEIENLQHQIDKTNERLPLIMDLIMRYEDKKSDSWRDVDTIVSNLLEGIGAVPEATD